MSTDPLKIGDRVSRIHQFPNELPLTGTVVERYASTPNLHGATLDLYAVDWDKGYIQRGYFRTGLELIKGS